ncbi:HlyD family secretion protein [Lysinibacillus fusiformis]|uniref:HlyD family secretion protein n=1 Tax=Lysinibacillus fusiformis TaxID=28031 RepID=UPI00263B6203|nr:HlyD family secretion protein [Lysinibacillus fusiformis]MDC6270259.1 HlyD family secretion protein [Lysinibacillus sphaericus]MDN4971688.1 HlyD family secretion protein [Lysinibacillus fusiformis]
MAFIKARPWTSIGIVVAMLIIGINAYFVFKEDSTVTRSYFIDEFQKAYIGTNTERVNKDTIVAPAETFTITADATKLSAVNVKRGQEVMMNDLLATFKTDEIDEELTKLESERTAYETELNDLQNALDQIEDEYDDSNPRSSINTDQINDRLSVTLKLELAQQNSLSTAVALLNRHIAETNRQIALIEAQITQIESRQGIVSPIDGVVSAVKEEAGALTFEIYSNEKAMYAYLSEKEWQKVQEGQTVDFKVKHVKDALSGIVLDKQMIATDDETFWANELAKSTNLPHPTNYEVVLQQDAPIEEVPFSTTGKASIIVNEAFDSYKVDKSWLATTKRGNKKLHIINQDGKIQLIDINVQFNTTQSAIFSDYLDEGTPMLSNVKRNMEAYTFRTLPIEKLHWKQFKELTWKQYVKYIVF